MYEVGGGMNWSGFLSSKESGNSSFLKLKIGPRASASSYESPGVGGVGSRHQMDLRGSFTTSGELNHRWQVSVGTIVHSWLGAWEPTL